MKKFLLTVLALYFLWWIFLRETQAPTPSPGVRIGGEPNQSETQTAPWAANDYTVRPLARYQIKARVLSKKRYYMDPTSDIAPYDLALGWGELSDSAVLKHVSIGQGGRWYDYTYDAACPVPRSAITRQTANVHCLPADSLARSQIKDLRVNSFVELEGYLVEVQKAGQSSWWRSSLVRNDEGAGACEVFWITNVTELPTN